MTKNSKNTYICFYISLLATIFLATGCSKTNETQDNVEEIYYSLLDSISCCSYGNIESIVNKTRNEFRDSTTYYIMEYVIATKHFYCNKPDSLRISLEKMKRWVEKHPNPSTDKLRAVYIRFMTLQAMYFECVESKIDSTRFYFKKAYDIVNTMDHPFEYDRVRTRLNLAGICSKQQDYASAISYYEEAVLELKNISDSLAFATVYMGIAKAYSAIKDYEQSNLWWEKVGGLEHFLPYTHRCQYYNDRGVDLLAQDRYSEGKEYFEKALDYIHKYNLGDWEEKFVKMNLAQAYLEMNEFHELKKILPEVETFFKEVDYKTALHFVKTLQIDMENHQVVTHLSLEEAKHLISTDLEDIDVPELQNERLKALLGRYAIANDGKRFYATYRVLDSLTSKQNDMNLRMRLSAFVATSELDDKIMAQQQEINAQKNQFIAAVSVLVALVMVMVACFIFLALQRRKREARESELRHKIVLLRLENVRNRITPHFLGNAITNILATDKNDVPERIQVLSSLLRKSQEAATELQIPLQEELSFVRDYIDFVTPSLQPNFNYSEEISDDINIHDIQIPSMVIQLYVENAVKHGLKSIEKDGCKHLVLSIQYENGGIMIRVRNNGCNIANKTLGNENTGLKIIRQTITMLNSQSVKQIQYGIGNEEAGFCSWLFIPNA